MLEAWIERDRMEAGCDEAGRGCLAGPVTAAAVVLQPEVAKQLVQEGHLNDSKKKLGSRVDRHDSIGKGYIGYDVFKFIMKSDKFNNIPLILETINPDIWVKEIEMLRIFENE